MTITCLFENETSRSDCTPGHGLSLLIEWEGPTVLFDTGDGPAAVENARILGKDLSKADIAVLSHGHHDHGGGIPEFLKTNDTAPVYAHALAFAPTLKKMENGTFYDLRAMSGSVPKNRLKPVSDSMRIADSVHILCGFRKDGFVPYGNRTLFWRNPKTGEPEPDPFLHEIALVLSTGGSDILITGCSHSGIGNMIRSAQTAGFSPKTVIGGFHLSRTGKPQSLDPETDALIGELQSFDVETYFTGHCTGRPGLDRLYKAFGDKIKKFSTGDVMHID